MAAPAQGSAAGVPQAIPYEQFLKCLLSSGLMSADEVKELSSAHASQDTRSLAQELINQGKLTRYQATMLCQGKTKGLVLGNYVMLEQLGQGGMGMVFKAQHRRMKREVAVKVLSPKICSDPTAVQRFQREVEAAAKLSHPNIVAAHDADEDRGVHFLVMEYVEGADLAGTVKKHGPLPVGQAVEAMLQAAHGLHHAHQQGIVHRDIKPHNLLLNSKGSEKRVSTTHHSPLTPHFVVKVLDMGLARVDAAAGNAAPAGELTESGSIMGTCDYMAPEQALNTKRADHRADIYSLGCTLYFVLTGRVMYKGETAMEKLMAHQQEPIPALRDARPDVPAELEAVYQQMVAKNVDERYQSMAEVIAALESCQAKVSSITARFDAETTVLPAHAAADPDDGETKTEMPRGRTRTKLSKPKKKRAKQRWLIAAGAGGLAVVVAASLFLTLGRGHNQKAGPNTDDDWVKSVQAKAGPEQLEAVAQRLRELNPGFSGKFDRQITDHAGMVTGLILNVDQVADVSPLRGLNKLVRLECTGSYPDRGILEDLSPLQGMSQLEELKVYSTRVKDLTPLRGLKLKFLHLERTNVADLTPLQGMPLTYLNVAYTNVADLAPLQGMPLRILNCMPSRVTDLSPLRGLPLEELSCPLQPVRDFKLLKSITTLRTINGKPAPEIMRKFPG